MRFRGIVTFVSEDFKEYMFLYTAHAWEGTMLTDCNEGTLEWVPKAKVPELPLWEGDKVFFRLLDSNQPFFSLKLVYEGEKLVQTVLDGKAI